MAYWENLAAEWRRNRRSARGEPTRKKSLRGRDFVDELARLFVLTKDRRFEQAMSALLEHGVVDFKLNFTRWRPPELAAQDDELERLIASIIDDKIKYDRKSVRRACAEYAAKMGHPATSFDAAVKDLQSLYARLGKSA